MGYCYIKRHLSIYANLLTTDAQRTQNIEWLKFNRLLLCTFCVSASATVCGYANVINIFTLVLDD